MDGYRAVISAAEITFREFGSEPDIDGTVLATAAREIRRGGLPWLVLQSNRENLDRVLNDSEQPLLSLKLLLPFLPDSMTRFALVFRTLTRSMKSEEATDRLLRGYSRLVVVPTYTMYLITSSVFALFVGFLPGLVRKGLSGMPLMLMILVFLFFTDDAWRLFGELSTGRLILALWILAMSAFLLLHASLKRERIRLYHYDLSKKQRNARTQLRDRLQSVDAAELFLELRVNPSPYGLETRNPLARANIAMLLGGRVGARCLALGIAVFGGFVVLGALLFAATGQQDFLASGVAPGSVLDFGPIDVSSPLLRVSGVLGGLALLYLVAVPLHDAKSAIRDAYVEDVVHEVGTSLALYSYYRTATATVGKLVDDEVRAHLAALRTLDTLLGRLLERRQAEVDGLAGE